MPEEFKEREQRRTSGRPYPGTVRTAGVIWIVFGCLTLLNAAVGLILVFATPDGANIQLTSFGVIPAVIALVFGAVFLYVGVQSARGTAKDTLGNGIGSILFGVLNGYSGSLLLLVLLELPPRGSAWLALLIIGCISFIAGIGLLAAGVLALIGRDDYKAWRRAQKRRTTDGGD